jgi:hypothetical protein
VAEVTGLRNNATTYPVYGLPWGIVFPLLDADGDPISPSSPDSEVSKNGDTFADCTNEATELATSSGSCYLLLTGTEMTADVVTVQIKSTGAKTTVITLYPAKLAILSTGTCQGSNDTGDIQLASGEPAVDDFYNGCICAATIDSTLEVRIINDYVGSTKVGEVAPAWNTAQPDSNDTYTIYEPLGGRVFKNSNLSAIAAAALSVSTAQLGVNVVNAAGTAWGSGAITNAAFAADAITAAKLHSDVTTELQNGLATAAALATVDTVVDAIQVTTDKLDDTLEDDAGTYRFTANALEEGPAGSGSAGPIVFSAGWVGNFVEDAVVKFKFTTRASNGAPITLAGSPALAVYKSSNVTQTTTGATIDDDFDGVTGTHAVAIDTSDAFYAVGETYDVVLTAGTVDGVSKVGEVVGSFTIENQFAEVDVTKIGGDAQSATDLKDFADAGYDPSTNKVQGVVLTDALTTYTGNTPQTGDSYAVVNSGTFGNSALKTLIDVIDGIVDTILVDTAELQTDWVNGGRLDLLIDAIKAKTDNLPSDPADASVVAGNITTAQAAILAKLLAYFQLALRKDAAIATDNTTELDEINADEGGGAGAYVNTTDALQALADAVDAVPTAAENQIQMDASSTRLATIAGDTTTDIPALIADVQDVVDANATALAAIEGKVDTVDTVVDAILLDTGTDGVVVAAGSKTGYALSSTGLNAIVIAEPTGKPSWGSSTIVAGISWVTMYSRNKTESTATKATVYADDGSTAVAHNVLSDDGVTFTSGEAVDGA